MSERNLLPTRICQYPTVKPWYLKTSIVNIFIEKKFCCIIGYTQRATLFFLKNINFFREVGNFYLFLFDQHSKIENKLT